MTETPVDVLNYQTKSGERHQLNIFGIDQLAGFIERDKGHLDHHQRRHRKQQLHYAIDYLRVIPKTIEEHIINEEIQKLKNILFQKANQFSGSSFIDELAKDPLHDASAETATLPLSNLYVRLMVLESLKNISSQNFSQKKQQLEKRLCQVLFDQIRLSWSESVLLKGELDWAAPSWAVFKYLERLTYFEQTKKQPPDSRRPQRINYDQWEYDSAIKSLFMFGDIDYETAKRFAEKYKIFPFSRFFTQEGQPNSQVLFDFAVASRLAPVVREVGYSPLSYDDIIVSSTGEIAFKNVPGVTFNPEQLLLACLSTGNSVYYPHLDREGKIVGTTVLELSRGQRYLLERKIRKQISKKYWKSLYPEREKKKRISGQRVIDYTVRQNLDGSIEVFDDSKKKVYDFDEGLIGFTIDNYGLYRLDLYYLRDARYYAAFFPRLNTYAVSRKFLLDIHSSVHQPNGLTIRERALETARHELNHYFWHNNLDDKTRKQIMDQFLLTDSRFKEFIDCFLYNDTYRQQAINRYQKNPQGEYIQVVYMGKTIRLAKEPIIDELLAWATWAEQIPEDKLSYLNPPSRDYDPWWSTNTRKVARKCLDGLPTEVKEILKKSGLYFERGSPDVKQFYDNFFLACHILAKEEGII